MIWILLSGSAKLVQFDTKPLHYLYSHVSAQAPEGRCGDQPLVFDAFMSARLKHPTLKMLDC